ncbi:GTP-binding protein [Sorangium cellulosum]|uniref:GTP-binding protein n=1 Tax=Sorangium cellulosum TaxID=56 RepID=A0A150PCY4_SORCE|nr:GTP-binding protein [Sorangium cellulosum]
MGEKRKVCLLGATGVGKTSLVARFARSIFSESYRTTIGVTIETRRVRCDDRELDLVLWDLCGEDEFQDVQISYVRGSAGFLIVIDGTRRRTVDTGLRLHAAARAIAGELPSVIVLNKADLSAAWEIDEAAEARLRRAGLLVTRTSARTGAGVEAAFGALARAMLATEVPLWRG